MPGITDVRFFLLAALCATLACASASAPELAASEAEVLAADRARIEAMIQASPAALDATLHATLTYTHSNGKLDSKTSLIESLTAGGVDYQLIEPIEPHVRIRGESAVLTARVRMEVEAAGQLHRLEMVYTAVYFLEAGAWQLAAYQSVGVSP